MTKKDLIEILQASDLPDGAMIVLSRDSEGNGFQELRDVEESIWSPRDGETHIRKLTPELVKLGFDVDDIYAGDDAQDCFTLWP